MTSTDHLYALIMAGGGGTRLWPLSRRERPKQMVRLFGDRTMFQWAVDRLRPLLPPERIFVVTGADQMEPLATQAPDLPRENFILEPLGRGTAPCIGLGAIHLHRRDPESVMAVVTADHFMRHIDRFCAVLAAAQAVAEQGYLVTLGIEPTGPATGYGYIRRGQPLGTFGDFPTFQVERFTEKPNAETALRFLQEGVYSWNSGMFIWRTERILAEFAALMPDLSATLTALADALGTPAYGPLLAQLWPTVRKEMIDYGVMEKADRVAVIPADLGWSDVGAWAAVMELQAADAAGNVSIGDHLPVDTARTMVFSTTDRLVATVGIHDLIIVDTPEALLIIPREQSERVREVVQQLEATERKGQL